MLTLLLMHLLTTIPNCVLHCECFHKTAKQETQVIMRTITFSDETHI